MNSTEKTPKEYVKAISKSGLSIYDSIAVGDPNLWIPSPKLEILLNDALKGRLLRGLPLRTRSKTVKTEICKVLGYPIPRSFARTKPRFPGQCFDIYVQKANNLQIWNEELSPIRRYIIIQVSSDDIISKVKVVTGAALALLDTTGTLTQKYQARLTVGESVFELISPTDTDNLLPLITNKSDFSVSDFTPTDPPEVSAILSITTVFKRLSPIVGKTFRDIGRDQERNRGAALHKIACEALGFKDYKDDGQFPDIRNQLIEVKLQTSSTIDLGLIRPDSTEPLDMTQIKGRQLRHCDVRYAIFYGNTDGEIVTLTHFYLTTGEAFFTRFTQFQGKVLNKKLQIPLPRNFFET